MKTLHQPLLLLTAFAFIAASRAALGQTVTNPGFEDNSNGGNGYGAISGWSNNVAASGVNTISQPFLEQAAHSGSQVAFIQQGAGGIPLSQSISGFDPTKTYSVTYFVSERGLSGASTSTSVSLDGGVTFYTQADGIRKTDKFRRIVSGPLAVSGVNSTLQLSAANGPGDDSLLIDSVSISRAVPAVPDNGFENPVQSGTGASGFELADGDGSGTLAGSVWTFSGKGGIARNQSSYTSTGQPQAPEGSQAAMLLTDNSSFSTLVSGFEAGVTYSLSFSAAGRAGTPALGPNTIEVRLGGSPLLFSGNATLTPTVSGSTYTTYTTDEFTTSGGSLELEFAGLTAGDKTSFIDDIRFNFIAEGDAPAGELKITSITKSGSTVTVQFEGIDGETYDLNKSTTLDFTTPDIKGTTTLSGTTGTLEDTTATEEKAFYRVEQQP
jgi:hypothetical protein